MRQHFLKYKSSCISYCVFGTGPQPAYCFHGYGENAMSFALLEKIEGDKYTFTALDLPYHGNTEWNDGLNFFPDDLIKILRLTVTWKHKKNITLIGYSMGGRVCLQLLELMPDKICKVVLLAPDGLHRNFWYHFSTQTIIGNRLFAYTMRRIAWLFAVMHILTKTGLLNKSVSKIAHYYLDDKKQRELLYKRWTAMRRFKPDAGFIKIIIGNYRIPVNLLFGKYDNIILSRNAKKLQKGNESLVNVFVAEAGHQLLKEKHDAIIRSLFI